MLGVLHGVKGGVGVGGRNINRRDYIYVFATKLCLMSELTVKQNKLARREREREKGRKEGRKEGRKRNRGTKPLKTKGDRSLFVVIMFSLSTGFRRFNPNQVAQRHSFCSVWNEGDELGH